jgi:hypothetical protein
LPASWLASAPPSLHASASRRRRCCCLNVKPDPSHLQASGRAQP